MGPCTVLLSLDRAATGAGVEAALACAGPSQSITLGIDIDPGTEAAGLVMLHKGERLPQKPLVCCLMLMSSHSPKSTCVMRRACLRTRQWCMRTLACLQLW